MPKHRHQLKTDIDNEAYNVTWSKYNEGWIQETNKTESPATHTTDTDGSQPHNMPSYLTVYIWKRIE